jgi:hypothetical protein
MKTVAEVHSVIAMFLGKFHPVNGICNWAVSGHPMAVTKPDCAQIRNSARPSTSDFRILKWGAIVM